MRLSFLASTILVALGGSAVAQMLPGPAADKPFTENWAPSKWGKDDRAGSANHTKNSDNVKRALATVKQFKSITVGKYYHREIPTFGPRIWNMVLPGTPQGGPFSKNALVYHDEYLTTEIGQVGTQFDGPVISASIRPRACSSTTGTCSRSPTSAARADARLAWAPTVSSMSANWGLSAA